MALRFKENYLVDEDGKIYLISISVVVEECLQHPYNTISVSKIILDTLARLTGEKIHSRNYSQTRLYRYIENIIQNDQRYQEAKKIKMVNQSVNRDKQKQYQLSRMEGSNLELKEIDRRMMRQYYRRRLRR